MIMTVLWLLKKFIEFATRPRNNLETSQIDLIDSSLNSESETDSTIIYLNCKVVDMKDLASSDKNKMLFRKSRCGQNKKRLNLVKKMEYEEAENRDILKSIMSGLKVNTISPASDCNSNNLLLPKENLLLRSSDSMQDCPDFLQDNLDYQWFLDYGYKENNRFHQQSILSLSRSQDFIYYNDMSKNIDANLAEVDMDEFNREDIHSILSNFPSIQGAEEREMFASVSDSIMAKLGFDTSISQQDSVQEDFNNCTSICKSQLLFSPVRESYMPNANLSVDSLDLSENDINLMVTCQANKNNYTIAFEGSAVLGSDDSESRETGTSIGSFSEDNEIARNREKLNNYPKNFNNRPKNSMACSDSTFTTWTKIKENFSEHLQLRRHPSGNNNTQDETTNICEISNSNTMKSLSLPNLCHSKEKPEIVECTDLDNNSCHNSMSRDQKNQKLYDIQNICNSKSVDHSDLSVSEKPAQSFSLLKLFIKQKSSSYERMSHNTNEHHILKDCFESKNKELKKNEQVKERNDLVYNVNKINVVHSNCGKNNFSYAKINQKKLNENDLQFKKNYILSREDKYCSDESTQENGSNTESAENICNCTKLPSGGEKKSITEKSIQTSALTDSKENVHKKSWKVPVYVLYPNYSLPNLEFLKKKHYVQNIDFSKVFMRPQKFKTSELPISSLQTNVRKTFSVKDIETLKKTGFKHIKDWESLAFLLPKEYKQFLPEIVPQLRGVKHLKDDLVPLFCLSPPATRKMRKRPISCDMNFFNNDFKNSNYSSTATQPSSGYRGSSTMLNSNNSYSTQSPKNPSYMHKYDSGLESGSPRRSGSLLNSKNIFINSRASNDATSARPPLRRSILKNNSLDNQNYTCKIQKENANKRYSMIELSERNFEAEEKSNKRRTNLNQDSDKKVFNKTGKENKLIEFEENNCSDEQCNLQNDMRRLEELLEISAVFGESVESFTESDMMRLRSQVSKFLTMHKNLEKVSETLQTVDSNETNQNNENKLGKSQEAHSDSASQLLTPHNTPEHKKQVKLKTEKDLNLEVLGLMDNSNASDFKPFDCGGRVNILDDDYKFNEAALGGLKKTVSFAEKIKLGVQELELKNRERILSSSPNVLLNNSKFHQNKVKRPVDLPIYEESSEGSLKDFPSRNSLQASAELLHKRDLILDVKNAVEKILKLFKETQENPAKLCLHHLCPSLYAVLSDGLREEIDTPFGPLRNSVWNVIEASSQQEPMTQTLNELVQRLNRDDIFTEGLIKFNAFIFGLLNARALSGWFSYLRTRDSLLRKYYDNSGLLLMSNTAGALIRVLVDKLINILEPLSSLHFNLDLMYQTKLLHSSLKNINCLLEEAENNDFLTPTKQLVLFKLVQSIQNSISQSGEGKKTKYVLDNIETKTSDLPTAKLLEKNRSIPVRRGLSNKVRPRSGYDILKQEKGSGDVASAIKKRWSGVHVNSKLVEAFDRLADESESEYTDSLDIVKPQKKHDKNFSSKNSTKKTRDNISNNQVLEVEDYTKEQKKNILLNLNKKSSGRADDNKTELEKAEPFDSSVAGMKNGHKFVRLQQKWEKLSKKTDFNSNEEVLPVEKTSSKENLKFQSSQKPSCDSDINLQSPTARISKIPRLVTSPVSSIPSTKQMGNVKKKPESPTSANNQNLKPSKSTSFGKLPSENNNNKVTSPGSNRLSRSDKRQVEKIVTGVVSKNQTNRPISLPYRGSNTLPNKKNEEITRRSSSMSLSRKKTLKKLEVPRTVLTLTHRLPSDSGHLSFNEGEKLKVVLEVDKKWLLCCRGTQKGLVPKSAVISDIEDSKF